MKTADRGWISGGGGNGRERAPSQAGVLQHGAGAPCRNHRGARRPRHPPHRQSQDGISIFLFIFPSAAAPLSTVASSPASKFPPHGWTNTTGGVCVCVQALNGTIAGRPFRLRRGEDGWKQKPFPIVKRQVCTTHPPTHPPTTTLAECGDLTNPSFALRPSPGSPAVRPAGVRGLFGGKRLRGGPVWRCALPQSPGHTGPDLTPSRHLTKEGKALWVWGVCQKKVSKLAQSQRAY